MYKEFRLFERDDLEDLIMINRAKHGNRSNKRNGLQAEIDLDVEIDGVPLTEKYSKNLDDLGLISRFFDGF